MHHPPTDGFKSPLEGLKTTFLHVIAMKVGTEEYALVEMEISPNVPC